MHPRGTSVSTDDTFASILYTNANSALAATHLLCWRLSSISPVHMGFEGLPQKLAKDFDLTHWACHYSNNVSWEEKEALDMEIRRRALAEKRECRSAFMRSR